MTSFISFANPLREVLTTIINSHELHAKWLNTLSFLENCGARKIAACEHPTLVKEEMLKHAAEEFRHAHHLKRQINKISSQAIDTYAFSYILGGICTWHYLSALDLKASRYLRKLELPPSLFKEAAYLLVTYAIERRAEELYPIYHELLKQAGSRVAVKSILLEEKEHLHEMKEGLKKFPAGLLHAENICAIESQLCETWLNSVAESIHSSSSVH